MASRQVDLYPLSVPNVQFVSNDQAIRDMLLEFLSEEERVNQSIQVLPVMPAEQESVGGVVREPLTLPLVQEPVRDSFMVQMVHESLMLDAQPPAREAFVPPQPEALVTEEEPAREALDAEEPAHEAVADDDDDEQEQKRAAQPTTIPFERLAEHVHIMQRVLHVSGNKYKNYYFLAVTFRNPILIPNHVISSAIRLTPGLCVVVDNTSRLNVQDASHESVIISCPPSVLQADSLEIHILLHLFQNQNHHIRHHTQYGNVLYVVTTTNPFQKFWKKNRKNQAFKNLCHLFEVCILQQSRFTLHETASMRLYKRNSHKDIFKYNNWYAMAWAMVQPHTQRLFHHDPTSDFGKVLFHIWKRSQSWHVAANHPPKEFYTCQVMLSDTEPVGIACAIDKDHIKYVSIMIVSFTTSWFLDTNNISCCFQSNSTRSAQCRYWIPLFKDAETWQTFSMAWYLEYLNTRTIYLAKILDWLFIQTAEPYVHIRQDLIQVYQILTGTVQSRWS